MARDAPAQPSRDFEMFSLRRRRSSADHRSGDVGGGRRGFSRLVHCNDPACPEAVALKYPGNAISTTKYTLANFLPKSLFEQFRRAANVFFLVVACISFSPLAPYRAVSILLPLIVVVSATMAKEAVEDWKRKKQDIEVNNRKVQVFDAVHSFYETEWKKLRVGDIVKVEKDKFFPADLFLLSTSFDDGNCFVETMNLDGETNLKRKQSLNATSNLQIEHSLQKFKALIRCEDPNEKLYSFIGTLNLEGLEYPLSSQQILLRDSKLRNTQHVYGVVIFTGHDTKVMQNAMESPSKRSNIEKRMDKIIYVLFACLAFIACLGSIVFGIKTREENKLGNNRWYLRPDDSSILFNPRRSAFAAFFHFLTDLMLYGCLIPISLYISIEIVKVLQSTFIDHDHAMYCEVSDKPARARTSNLNEELGQVDTILSDKTGTLTCNSMEFLKCSIAGVAYGYGLSEVDRAFATGIVDDSQGLYDSLSSVGHNFDGIADKLPKCVKFNDKRLMNGQWVKECHLDFIKMFFQTLAICHTAIPVVKRNSDEISYEAESPDEAAFVKTARELGFEFYGRTQRSISLHELDPKTGRIVNRTYELLNVLEFSSARKRMSVIVRTEENELLLLCKGADSVIFQRLSKEGQVFESNTKDHINYFSEAGLRTLAVAYRVLTEEEYVTWNDDFLLAKTSSLDANHDAVVDEAAEKIERDLILLGATAVEDKLQDGVPECINKLAQAGIKIWILTGDKLETAVNIGFSCQLLRKGMEQIVISLDTPNIDQLKHGEEKEAIETALEVDIAKQIHEAHSQVSRSKGSSTLFALIIDGEALAFALSKSLEGSFLDLAVDCASVICCRTSPKQKALVTGLVKKRTKKTTLAIGDGANDVGMLQEADIGVGINGVEGMQAVMSSDFSIAQFRFLEQLLLVHGHWCYRRIAAMVIHSLSLKFLLLSELC